MSNRVLPLLPFVGYVVFWPFLLHEFVNHVDRRWSSTKNKSFKIFLLAISILPVSNSHFNSFFVSVRPFCSRLALSLSNLLLSRRGSIGVVFLFHVSIGVGIWSLPFWSFWFSSLLSRLCKCWLLWLCNRRFRWLFDNFVFFFWVIRKVDEISIFVKLALDLFRLNCILKFVSSSYGLNWKSSRHRV